MNEIQMRTIKSFVKRQGRISHRQSSAYEKLWAIYGLQNKREAIDYRQIFAQEAPLVLEIGFGMGQSLLSMAQNNPDYNFIGIEVHRPGIGSVLAAMEENKISNIRIYNEDAIEVLKQSVADESLSYIFILFPDPWPKSRHHKRRLVQISFINLLKQKLKPGGQLHLATDWEDYAKHMLKIFAHDKSWLPISRSDTDSKLRRPQTKFERRGLELGHKIYDLVFAQGTRRII